MIKPEELRIGNCIQNKNGFVSYITGIFKESVHVDFDGNNGDIFKIDSGDLYPVTLTEELLLKCGFKKEDKIRLTNSFTILLKNNKRLIISCVGSSNEISWIESIEDSLTYSQLVCVHNYIYDGFMPLHKLQNICYLFSNKELEVNL